MGISATELERATSTLDAGWRAAGIQPLLVRLAGEVHRDEHLLAWCPGRLDGAVSAVLAVTDRGVVVVTAPGEVQRVPWDAVDAVAGVPRPGRALVVSVAGAPFVALDHPPLEHLAAVLHAAAVYVGAGNP